jgi:ESS family glutamate:Na+ symporter
MTTLELNGVWTLLLALVTIEFGKRLNKIVVWLDRGNIPPAVSAGLLLSLVFALARHLGWFDVKLTNGPRDVLLLVFFASLGFGAHLKRLASAGGAAFAVCLAIAIAIVVQNAIGMVVARAFGEPAALGLFMGSIAFLGGHGTATAWAEAPQAAGLVGAFEVGIGSATLGLVLGGLAAGPLAVWLMTQRRDGAAATVLYAAADEPAPAREPAFSSDRWLPALLWLLTCLALGPLVGRWVHATFGMQLPGFLTALLVGVVITNLMDLARRPLDTETTDLIGTVALRIFLAIALLSLDWAALAHHLPMLLTAAAAQVVAVGVVAVLVIYLFMGRDRDAAAASGGFVGFGLGAMPVGLAVMRRLAARFGDTPRALLAITLAASLFQDTANALILTATFGWLGR